MTPLNDNDIWLSLKNDDPQALGDLYDKYVDKLFIAALAVTSDRDLAKDALQEMFIQVWNYRKTIAEVQDSKAYLTRVLRSILFKKLKVFNITSLSPESAEMLAPEQNMEEMMVSLDTDHEQLSKLERAMATLSQRQKQIVELRFYQGLSYNQIASKLGMNYQSVNNLAFRTFRRLREAISTLSLLALIGL